MATSPPYTDRPTIPALTAALILGPLAAGTALAYDVNDKLSIGGILAAAGQCQNVSATLPAEGFGQAIPDTDPQEFDGSLDAFGNECRGGMPIQVEFGFHPTESDQFFVALGWAVDNGLNAVSPWRLAPWAADLEDDVKDINGSSRDYLLQAWYRHRFQFQGENSIAGTFGIIDSTAYIDGNAYANDEYTQFMNEAFVNAGNYNLPSYDAGVALEGSFGAFSLNAVGMNINENDEGYNYNFWGVQAAWHPEFKMGAGNYRVNITGSSSAFLSPPSLVEPDPDPEAEQDLVLVGGQVFAAAPGERKSRLSWGLSFDQAIGENLGLFLRLAWQDRDAAVDYEALYSGGLNVVGNAWGRESDNIGIGYAYLEGGNLDISGSHVFEAYYRVGLNDHVGLTADLQYMSDDRTEVDPLQENPEGWILGMRLTAEF
jgi:porin